MSLLICGAYVCLCDMVYFKILQRQAQRVMYCGGGCLLLGEKMNLLTKMSEHRRQRILNSSLEIKRLKSQA